MFRPFVASLPAGIRASFLRRATNKEQHGVESARGLQKWEIAVTKKLVGEFLRRSRRLARGEFDNFIQDGVVHSIVGHTKLPHDLQAPCNPDTTAANCPSAGRSACRWKLFRSPEDPVNLSWLQNTLDSPQNDNVGRQKTIDKWNRLGGVEEPSVRATDVRGLLANKDFDHACAGAL
jgi:hypothetical protein